MLTVVPFVMRSVSGSKSHFGSGLPAAASANKSSNVVNAPSATFLQKSAPSAALKVAGSHSSKATICARLGGFSCASAADMALPCVSTILPEKFTARGTVGEDDVVAPCWAAATQQNIEIARNMESKY